MTFADELYSDVESVLKYGQLVRLKYYTGSFNSGSYYDDDVSYTQSGTDYWTTGLICPIDSRLGGHDALLLQQGKILYDDKRLYVNGSTSISGLNPIKIGLGSPIQAEFQIIDEGRDIMWSLENKPIYKKVYIRYLTNGSFVGE
jgi:hypothetical protein